MVLHSDTAQTLTLLLLQPAPLSPISIYGLASCRPTFVCYTIMDNAAYITSPDMLTAENIFLQRGRQEILKGATIKAARGTVTGLLGRNGSGKSCMLRAIFGTMSATDCDVFVNGIKTHLPYTAPQLLNYLPQRSLLPPSLTVEKVFRDYCIDPETVITRFPELRKELKHKIRDLSGGTERLVSVLLLLLADTRFTLLDEPFTQLMSLHIERLQQLIAERKHHKGIIITDHRYKELLSISDTLYLMKDGQTTYIRNKEDLVLHGYVSSSSFM